MKYKYHIRVFFSDIQEEWRHCFDSDSEILRESEVRREIIEKCSSKPNGFHVLSSCKLIKD